MITLVKDKFNSLSEDKKKIFIKKLEETYESCRISPKQELILPPETIAIIREHGTYIHSVRCICNGWAVSKIKHDLTSHRIWEIIQTWME